MADKLDKVLDAVKDAAEDVKDKAYDAKDSAKDKADDVKDKAKELVSDAKDKMSELKDKAAQKVDEKCDPDGDDIMDAIEGSPDPLEEKAETLARWAAGRAAVIVLAPGLGTIALMANELYAINRMAKLYNKDLSDRAAISFLGAFGGTLAGNLLATLIPIPGLSMPIAVGVTYGVTKAAQAWIQDDLPKDMDPYLDMFKEWSAKAKQEAKVFADNPLAKIPLGDETKDYLRESGSKLSGTLEDMKVKVGEALENGKETLAEKKEVVSGKASEKAANAKVKAAETGDVLREKGEDLALGAASVLGAIAEKLSEFADSYKEKVEKYKEEREMSDFMDKVKETAQEVKEGAKDVASDVADKVKDTADEVKEGAKEAWEGTKDVAQDAKESVKDTMDDAKDKIDEHTR